MFEDEIVVANTAVDNNVLITGWTQIRTVSQRPRRCVIPHAELVTQRGAVAEDCVESVVDEDDFLETVRSRQRQTCCC